MGSRILLLDASTEAGPSLSSQFALCGFVMEIARDLDGALRLLSTNEPALTVVRAPSADAAQYCRAVRAASERPLVFVCDERNEAVIVDCLRAGADSVLLAPLSRRELEARVRAWLARPGRFRPVASARVRSIGDLVIDPESHVVTKAGRSVSLTPTEFRLLASLARGAGRTVTHQELLAEVWGAAGAGSEHLRLYVRYLRQKLEDDHRRPTLLLNRRGIGYALATTAAANKQGERS